jgi:antitoxin HicB
MKNYITSEYPVDLSPDDNDTFLVTSPDFPELTTFGEDKDSAIGNAIGAFVTLMSERMEARENIPIPSRIATGQEAVALPPLIGSKIALYWAMRDQNISQVELADRLDCDPKQVRRLLDPINSSRQEHLDAAPPNNSLPYLIFRHFCINNLCPGSDTAFKVQRILIAILMQPISNLRRATAKMAHDDQGLITRQLFEVGGQRIHRNV